MTTMAIFRDRTKGLEPGSLQDTEAPHQVQAPQAEGLFRRYAGRFVAVLRTATAQAYGNTVAWVAGFSSRQAAERALAEALAARLRVHGHDLAPSEVQVLARRSSGKEVPPWGGPARRFARMSLLLHYGRVYTPLNADEQEADNAAFEAYMAKREAEEAEAKARAEAELARQLAEEAAAKADAEKAEAKARAERAAAERESREAREDRELVSRLLWRVMDRQGRYQRRYLRKQELSRVADLLRYQGIRWNGLETPQGALALVRATWFRAACMRNPLLRKLRWNLMEAAYRLIESSYRPADIAEALRDRFEAYVARRRRRIRAKAAQVATA